MSRELPALSRRRYVAVGILAVAVAGLTAGSLTLGGQRQSASAPDANMHAPSQRVEHGAAQRGESGLPATVYEQNVGQTDPAVNFISRRPGYTLFVTDDEAVMSLAGEADGPSHVVRQRLVGARAASSTRGLDPRDGTTSYIKGNDSSKWVTGAPHFGRVLQTDVYDGVDLVWHGNEDGVEYDFIVAAGASPEPIGVTFEGTRDVRIEPDGSLAVESAGGTLAHQAPVAYQDVDGEHRLVDCSFERRDDGSIGFTLGAYDETIALVIDPFVDFATFLGGSSHDHATSIVKRPYGETFVAGYTSSADFPDQSGGTVVASDFDAFVVRYDAFGGSNAFIFGGSLNDRAYGVFADKDEVWICGETQSRDLPTAGGPVQSAIGGEVDGFFAAFTHSGGLTYGSYLGGTWNDVATEIQIAGDGRVVVGGRTVSLNFPTVAATQGAHGGTNGAFDAFVSRLNVARTALDFSTFYGGEGSDLLYDLEVTSAGEIFICGYTNSNFLPTTAGAVQETNFTMSSAFAARLDPSVSDVVWSTYLGGNGWSWANGIAVDGSNAAYVTGYTDNIDFPTTPGVFQEERRYVYADAFVTKIAPDGMSLAYSTYLGGRAMDVGNDIWVRSTGEAVVVGGTGSAEFPVTEAADQTVYMGGGALFDLRGDGFIARLSDDADDLEYGQFLGACAWDTSTAISPIRILPSDDVSIPVSNSGFESPPLVVGTEAVGTFDSWFATAIAGLRSPAVGEFNGGVVTGVQVGAIATGTLRQVLDHTLLPLARYTVTVDVLDNTLTTIPGYDINLLAGTDPYFDGVTDWGGGTVITTLATIDETGGGIPADGGKATVTFTFDTTFATAEIGQTLGIELSSDGFTTWFDEVRISVEPLPSDDLFDVAGDTASSDFPLVSPVQGTFGGLHDAFLAAVDLPDGNGTVLATVQPHDLFVSVLGSSAVELTWTHDIPDLEFRTSSTISDIVIQRAPPSTMVFAPVDIVPIGSFSATGTQTYTDHSVTSSTGYLYRVLAIGTHSCDFASSDICLQTLPHLVAPLMARPDTPPAAPIDVVAAQSDPRTFVVAWAAGAADPGGGYEVFRSEGDDASIGVGVVPAGDTSFVDRTDVREPDVTYVVRPLGGENDQVASAPYTVFRTESLGLGIVRGRVTDATREGRDSFRASGRLLLGASAFDPAVDTARVVFGSAVAPVAFDIPAGDRGWSTRRGRLVWDSTKSDAVAGVGRVKLELDPKRDRFRVRASRFDFPGDQATAIVGAGLRLGRVVGGDQREFDVRRGRTRKLRR